MKPPPVDVAVPTSLDEALDALARPGAVVLAGGQSLLQDLRWRRLQPSVLVDVADVDELTGVTGHDDEVRIGARVRHVDLERGAVDGPLGALMAEAAGWIAHPPVRSRGTLAGSLAWAHPTSEWCALVAGLAGRVELSSVRGRRELPVEEFLRGPGVTARADDEMVTAVVLPRLPAGTRTGVAEHRRTHASFAEVVVVAAVTPTGTRLGVGGIGPTAIGTDGGRRRGDGDAHQVAGILSRRLLERLEATS